MEESLLENISLGIAVISICIAMFTAGWTFYRDAIQTPTFRVSIAIKSIYQAGQDPIGPNIFLEALNMGPLPNRLGVAWCRKSWWQRYRKPKESLAHIYSDYGHVAATQSGQRIEVGDTGTHVFPYDGDCFLKFDWVEVGVAHGYGRMHWAPRSQLRQVLKKYRADFPQEIPLDD